MGLALLMVAVGSFIYLVFTLVEVIYGFNQLKNLSSQAIASHDQLPSISIIFSALNEEKHIEAAVVSFMNLNYPHYEVIAVNDRSTDTTPTILDALQKKYPQLRVHHIHELPPAWFGKNHALYCASLHAQGDWLLFTDADVEMKKDTLLKTISYALEKRIDHLTIYEHHHRNTFWLKILLLGHYVSYSMAMKPWRIRHTWSKKSLGHGAFNLIKKQTYEACDGHRAIAMECLDDLKLGELVKKNGFRQDIVNGRNYIEREWYSSLKDMINGMEKNCFAYFNYQIIPVIRDMIFATLFYLWPPIDILFFSGPEYWFNVLNVLLMLSISVYVADQFRLKKRYAIFYPAGVILLIYTIFNSVISTYRNNGVTWRGTHYPLKNLRHSRRKI